MRVVCIEISDEFSYIREFITTGKIYDVIEDDSIGYRIIDDNGNDGFYSKSRFRKLSYVRNERLNDLGI